MAQLKKQILLDAQSNGLLDGVQREYVNSSINTANRIIACVQQSPEGIETSQLQFLTNLNMNTLRMYCRLLSKIKVLNYDILPDNGQPKKYFIYQ